MQVEADSIRRCTEQLDPEQTEKALTLLLNCRGKAVVLGVGKSGIVAHKIAATLSSTGTPAIHLHASDAVHGDLGLVESRDVVIAISNSGATDEIVALLPHLQLRKVPLIAIVGNIVPRWPPTPTPCSTPPSAARPARSTWRPPPAPPWPWPWATPWP
jgi:arabinose-5-phosphate isomerase